MKESHKINKVGDTSLKKNVYMKKRTFWLK